MVYVMITIMIKKKKPTTKLSRIPWEVIVLAIGLLILGLFFHNLGQSTSVLQDGLFPNW